MPRLSTNAGAAVLAAALAASASGVGADPQRPPAGVTFAETIAPILHRHCASCHRPGEAAPFALLTYEDAARRARLIAEVTASRLMPPWHAAHGYGEFADERRLSDDEIGAIAAWAKSGTPRGDLSKLPAAPVFADGWQLGTPDLILEMPEAFEVPADGPDLYRNFALATGLTEDRYVRAIEFRPSARQVVHHALFQYVRGGSTEALGRDGRPGFGGSMPVTFVQRFSPSGDLGGWAVGTTPREYPDGLSLPLPKGSDLVLQMHFHPSGRVERERARVGLYFADAPPSRRVLTPAIPGLFGLVAGIDIPAGEKHYEIAGTMTLPIDVRVLSVAAHAHYLGKEIRATATLPDGATQPLLWIRDWDFNWQDRYIYRTPVALPRGTRIDVTISYDNSADNPRNPCQPPRRVRWGLQSFDEMGSVRFEMVALAREDEAAWQQWAGEVLKRALQSVAQRNAVKEYGQAQAQFRVQGDPCK
jgi:mono/diheme cytochrome c family protein